MTTVDAFVVHALKQSVRISVWLVAAAVIAAALPQRALGAEGPATPPIARELIPGAERLSAAEREVYRSRMQAAATPEEQEKIRAEYAKSAKAAASQALRGDPERGSKLHRACFYCHGIERYTQAVTYAVSTFSDSLLRASGLSDMPPAPPARFKGRIQSLVALRDAVERRNDFFNPKMTPQEIEDVIAYLNVTYYKFPE